MVSRIRSVHLNHLIRSLSTSSHRSVYVRTLHVQVQENWHVGSSALTAFLATHGHPVGGRNCARAYSVTRKVEPGIVPTASPLSAPASAAKEENIKVPGAPSGAPDQRQSSRASTWGAGGLGIFGVAGFFGKRALLFLFSKKAAFGLFSVLSIKKFLFLPAWIWIICASGGAFSYRSACFVSVSVGRCVFARVADVYRSKWSPA